MADTDIRHESERVVCAGNEDPLGGRSIREFSSVEPATRRERESEESGRFVGWEGKIGWMDRFELERRWAFMNIHLWMFNCTRRYSTNFLRQERNRELGRGFDREKVRFGGVCFLISSEWNLFWKKKFRIILLLYVRKITRLSSTRFFSLSFSFFGKKERTCLSLFSTIEIIFLKVLWDAKKCLNRENQRNDSHPAFKGDRLCKQSITTIVQRQRKFLEIIEFERYLIIFVRVFKQRGGFRNCLFVGQTEDGDASITSRKETIDRLFPIEYKRIRKLRELNFIEG